MDGEVKVSILQWENLRKEIGELTEENARLKNQQGLSIIGSVEEMSLFLKVRMLKRLSM